jgi:myosin-5
MASSAHSHSGGGSSSGSLTVSQGQGGSGQGNDLVWVPDPGNVFDVARIVAVNGSSSFDIQALRPNDRLTCTHLTTGATAIYSYGAASGNSTNSSVGGHKNGHNSGDDKYVLPYDVSHDQGVHDLGLMNNLNNAAVLNTVRTRYVQRGAIYTAMHPLFISVNPYQDIPDLYNIRRYESLISEEKEAHIFTMVKRAIDSVMSKNQAIIVRGESGAGKTEACKRILSYMISPDRSTSILMLPSSSASTASVGELLNKKLIACNPILESFGNACTIRNDNSSRFGKYLKIMFDEQTTSTSSSGSSRSSPGNNRSSPGGGSRNQQSSTSSPVQIQGAAIQHYLLERSRVVSQAPGERNYHVFYQLLSGCNRDPKLMSTLQLAAENSSTSGYNYICEGSLNIESDADYHGFHTLVAALQDIGIDESKSTEIFKLLAAVLHLGNIQFRVDPENEWGSVVHDKENNAAYKFAEEVLGIAGLATNLTMKSVSSARGRQSMIMVNYTVEKAIAITAAVAKEIYDRLFQWLIYQCNQTLYSPQQAHYIGLLDLFGFEVFPVNSFEQLCINYCNEKLQSLFNELLFENEVRIYLEEGIQMDCYTFEGNRHCLDLFESDMGIFRVIDGQCALGRSQQTPQEEARALLKQLEQVFTGKNDHFGCRNGTGMVFYVIHFAGKVEYDLTQFIAKNTDKLEGDLEKALLMSDNELLSELFDASIEQNATNTGTVSAPVESSPPGAGAVRRKTMTNRKKQNQTVGSKFRASVRALMTEFAPTNTQVQYLKCIKPNVNKRPNEFNSQLVYQQLKYSGILEVVRIRQAGYPLRETWSSMHRFLVKNYIYMCVVPGAWQRTDRVSMLVDGVSEEYYPRLLIQKLLPPGKWFVGRTKLFFKEDVFVSLLALHKIYCARAIQRRLRGHRERRRVRSMVTGFKRMLVLFRRWRAKKKLEMAKRGMILFTFQLRFRVQLKAYRLAHKMRYYRYLLHRWRLTIRLRRRRAVSLVLNLLRRHIWRHKMRCLALLVHKLQAVHRGRIDRSMYARQRWAICRIQRFWRRCDRIFRFIDLVYAAKLYAKRFAIAVLLKNGNFVCFSSHICGIVIIILLSVYSDESLPQLSVEIHEDFSVRCCKD